MPYAKYDLLAVEMLIHATRIADRAGTDRQTDKETDWGGGIRLLKVMDIHPNLSRGTH